MAISRNGMIVRYFGTIFSDGTSAGLGDAQLLERFAQSRDDAAFEVLVIRHGPMVLRTCRALLRDPHDADDAFQATFLVLARRAGVIRFRGSLAPWLYGVTHRVARRLRDEGIRRSRRRVAIDFSTLGGPSGDPDLADLHRVVHEEVRRLPEKYRDPILLCSLAGLSHDQAAALLGWPVGTVRGRLSRARDLLRPRLLRRGLAPSTAVLTLTLGQTSSGAALPSTLLSLTTSAAVRYAASRLALAGTASAAAATLSQGVLRTMLVSKTAAIPLALVVAVTASVQVVARQESAQRSFLDQPPALANPQPKPSPLPPRELATITDAEILLSQAKVARQSDDDGDGIADSVWLDLGYPIQKDEQGQPFKLLIAYKAGPGLNGIPTPDGPVQPPAAAADPQVVPERKATKFEGQTISELRIRGLVHTPIEAVLGVIRTRPGQTLSWARIESDFKAIEKTMAGSAIRQSVNPDDAPGGSGVIVTFWLKDPPTQGAIPRQAPGEIVQAPEARDNDKDAEGSEIAEFRPAGKLWAGGRIVSEIRVRGLKSQTVGWLRRLVLVRAGQPVNAESIEADLRRLNETGLFSQSKPFLDRDPSRPETAVILTYAVEERLKPTTQRLDPLPESDLPHEEVPDRLNLLAPRPGRGRSPFDSEAVPTAPLAVPSPKLPVPDSEAGTGAILIEQINADAARLKTLASPVTVKIGLKVLHGDFAYERPRNFRMILDTQTGSNKIDLGSNSETFWFREGRNMPNRLFRYRDDARPQSDAAMRPDWFAQSLGLLPISGEEARTASLTQSPDGERVLTLQNPGSNPDEVTLREIVLDAELAWVKEHRLLTSTNRGKPVLLARAQIKRTWTALPPDRNRARAPRPAELVFSWFASDQPKTPWLQVSVHLTRPVINEDFDEERRQALFNPPVFHAE